MIWLTSDLHLLHNKDFLYKPRGFDNILDHNKAIIENFNSVVKDDDDLYILGDVFLNSKEEGIELLKQIPGIKHIIIGNHDTDARLELFEKHRQECKICEVVFGTRLKYKKFHFLLSHYPTITSNLDDGKKVYETVINLYGHTHQQTNFYNNNFFMYHVGLDSHNMMPISLDTIIEEVKEKYKEIYDEY